MDRPSDRARTRGSPLRRRLPAEEPDAQRRESLREVHRRARTNGGLFAALAQASEREISDRRQHVEAPVGADPNERLVPQRRDERDRSARRIDHRLRRLDPESAAEDRDGGERASFAFVEQIPRPRHAALEGLVVRHSGSLRAERVEAIVHSREQIAGRERSKPRGRELDSERNALEALEELDQRGANVGIARRPRRASARRVEEEQASARARLELLGAPRRAQRLELVHVLGREPGHHPRGHEETNLGCGVDPSPERVHPVRHELFEVVEHEQRRLERREGVGDRSRRLGHRQRARDRGSHRRVERGGALRRHQLAHHHLGLAASRGELEREAALAHAARADERDETRTLREEPLDPGHVGVTADEASQRAQRRCCERSRSSCSLYATL
jgi:hypothetical protein